YTAWTMTALELLPHVVYDLGQDAVLAMTTDGEGRRHLRELVERAWPAWPPWVEGRVTRNVLLELGFDALVLADPAAGFESERGAGARGGLARAGARRRPVRPLLRPARGVARRRAHRERRLRRRLRGRRAAAAARRPPGRAAGDGHGPGPGPRRPAHAAPADV